MLLNLNLMAVKAGMGVEPMNYPLVKAFVPFTPNNPHPNLHCH